MKQNLIYWINHNVQGNISHMHVARVAKQGTLWQPNLAHQEIHDICWATEHHTICIECNTNWVQLSVKVVFISVFAIYLLKSCHAKNYGNGKENIEFVLSNNDINVR